MKNFSLISLAAAAIFAASCGTGTTVSGTLSGVSEAPVVAALLNVNTYDILDTLATDKNGNFKLSVPVKEGEPEFVYLFYKDTKVASLLLEAGENAVVEADTLGHYSVKGSRGSEDLQKVEARFSRFLAEIGKTDNSSEFVRQYIAYYRESVRYIMENPHSLTVIPVLYEKIGDFAPVFAQSTDALHFRRACDSLKLDYPESRYVKALESEAVRREKELKVEIDLKQAASVGYPDLKMPDINGRLVALSSLKSKVVLVHFWDSSDPVQSMFTKEVLAPIYNDYHKRGFEIYSVCLDADKARWSSVVKNQKLDWINVNDGLGAASKSVSIYNLSSVPASILIANGDLVTTAIKGETGLRKELARLLK